jgi:hypothetical protein
MVHTIGCFLHKNRHSEHLWAHELNLCTMPSPATAWGTPCNKRLRKLRRRPIIHATAIHNFRYWCYHLVKNYLWIYLEVVPSMYMHCSQHLRCAFHLYLQSRIERSHSRPSRVSNVGGGRHTHVVFGNKFPGTKEVWDGALLWCNSQSFYRQSLRQSIHTFSSNHH